MAKAKKKKKATRRKASGKGRKSGKSAKKKSTRSSADRGKKKKMVAKKSAKKSSKKPSKKSARPGKAKAKKKAKRNAGMTSRQLGRYRGLLLAKRAMLLGDMTSMANEALGKNRQESSGDLSNMPIHMADIGSDNYEQEFTLGLLESERTMLREIDRALERIAAGTYGVCMGTGQVIGKVRLEAKPWAKYHIDYARLVEKGLAPDVNGNGEDSDDDQDDGGDDDDDE